MWGLTWESQAHLAFSITIKKEKGSIPSEWSLSLYDGYSRLIAAHQAQPK